MRLKKYIYRVGGVVISALLFSSVLTPHIALAVSSTDEVTDGGDSVERTYTYLENETEPVIEQEIEIDGVRYVFEDKQESNKDAKYETPQKEAVEDVVHHVSIMDASRLDEVIPREVFVEDGTYKGNIGLDPENPYTVKPLYEPWMEQVDRDVVLENLPDNNAEQISKTRPFTVRSDAYPGATQERELELTYVEFELTGTTELGRPNSYTAYLKYRGQEEYLVLDSYEVTAHYKGMIADTVAGLATVVTYKVSLTDIDDDGIPLSAIAVGTTAAAGAGLAFGIGFYIRSTRLKIVETGLTGKDKIVGRTKLRRDGDTYIANIPIAFILSSGNGYYGICPKRLINRGALVVVNQSNTLIYEGKAKDYIALISASTFQIDAVPTSGLEVKR